MDQYVRDQRRRAHLVPRQLGVGVDVPAQGDHPVHDAVKGVAHPLWVSCEPHRPTVWAAECGYRSTTVAMTRSAVGGADRLPTVASMTLTVQKNANAAISRRARTRRPGQATRLAAPPGRVERQPNRARMAITVDLAQGRSPTVTLGRSRLCAVSAARSATSSTGTERWGASPTRRRRWSPASGGQGLAPRRTSSRSGRNGPPGWA